MVARPIGAASAPPVAESRSPPFSTSTATATRGLCAGAKAMYQAAARGVLESAFGARQDNTKALLEARAAG